MEKSFTEKLWKLMKICAAQGMIALIVCGVSMGHTHFAQVLDKEITIRLSDVPFDQALHELADAAKVKFAYSIDQLNTEESVSLEADRRTLRDVLDELLEPLNIKYKVHEKEGTITLKKYNEKGDKDQSFLNDETTDNRSILFMQVTGTVTDASTQQPMAGVNIIVKGTTNGTATDADGKFTIQADDNDVLVFSFIGFKSLEMQVSGRSVIDVSMEVEATALQEVVINAGYWQVRKKEQTGSIAKVTTKDIEKQPVSNPLMAIQGRMPGVVITQTSGIAGSGMKLQIRGQNSLRNSGTNNGNYPLYVVDGVPIASNPITPNGQLLSVSAGGIDPLNTINPANIESIEILKDADATAIYGSRGANGVVLITSKKGRSGTTSVDIQGYTGAGQVSKMMDLMNTEQYLAMRNEAFTNDGKTPGASDYDLNGSWDQNSNTDWQKKLIGGTANISDMQAFISGGSGNTSFRFGGGYHKETTVFPGSFGYNKVTGSFNLNHATVDQKFQVTLSMNYGRDNNNLFNKNIASYARTLAPNAPLYDDQGNLVWTGYTSTDNANPMSYFKTSDVSKTGNLISNAVVSYEIFKGLRLVANLGYNDVNTNQVIKTPQSSMNPASPSLSSTDLMLYSGKNWIVEPQLTYTTELGGGRLDFLVGTTWQAFDTKNFSIQGQGYTSDALLGNVRSAATITVLNDTETKYRYNAVFGRLGYIWKDRYLVNLTARRDGSSRFGADNQFGNFGAIGAGWIFSNEEFVKNGLPFLSFGKLRASYGTTGNDQIGDYGYISTYTAASNTYQGTGILNATGLSNPDFAWEVNKKLETAIDLSLLQNRIQFSTSWYRNRSSNQLVGYPLPAITGFSSIQYNLNATVENTGWEIELNSANIESNNFRWSTSINITIPENKLVSYPNIAGSSYANTYVVGKPLTISKRYIFDGIDPETGLYKILDLDNDGSYTDADKQGIVDLSRQYYGGVQNTVSFRSFELNFLIEIVQQNGIDYKSLFTTQPGGRMYNQLNSILSNSRWQTPGDQTELQKFTQAGSSSYAYAGASNGNVTDASFIRMKTIYLSYRLASRVLEKIKVKEGQLYLQAQNLFTITDFYGFNPESPYLELPPLRVYSAGIKFKF